MRKIELIELILDFLNGGDGPGDLKGRFHDAVIKAHVELAFKNVVFQTYMEGKMHSDYSVLDAWSRSYTLNIAGDDDIVYLPFPPIQLPNNMGILQVTPTGDLENAFAYRETNANAVFAALEVGSISETPTFYLEQNNTGTNNATHLLRVDNIPNDCTQVDVKMIVPLEVVDDFDTIVIPAGKENLIRDEVINLLMNKPPEDTTHDNKASR